MHAYSSFLLVDELLLIIEKMLIFDLQSTLRKEKKYFNAKQFVEINKFMEKPLQKIEIDEKFLQRCSKCLKESDLGAGKQRESWTS